MQVIQYGYIAMFCCSFPLGTIASAGVNILELKLDAQKLMCARPGIAAARSPRAPAPRTPARTR